MTSTWSDSPRPTAPSTLDRARAALDVVKAIGDSFEADPLRWIAAGGVSKQQFGGMAWAGALAAVSIAESLDRIAGAVERIADLEELDVFADVAQPARCEVEHNLTGDDGPGT